MLFSWSVVSNSLQPHRLPQDKVPCPSLSPGVFSNLCPLSWWCYPTISSSVAPFSFCLQSFPASGSFPVSQLFASGSQLLLLLLLLSRFSCVRLCATPWTAAYQASPSLGFSRQEHRSGLPFPSPMHESGKWKGSRSVKDHGFKFKIRCSPCKKDTFNILR